MSDEIRKLERDIDSLKHELDKEKSARSGDKKIVSIIAVFITVLFGYTNFLAVPREITKALTETAARKASDKIEVLRKEAAETLLPEIRGLLLVAKSAREEAEQSAKSADASAKDAAEAWRRHASADLKKLQSLLPKPAKLSLVYKDLGKVLDKWCGFDGAKTSWADVNGDGKADIICDSDVGRHWIRLSKGDGSFEDLGRQQEGWCRHQGARTSWADVNGDKAADMICDDSAGAHWIKLINSDL